MESPVQFPAGVSDPAKSIITQLLDKNPVTRLGSRLHGAGDIMAHPFFGGLQWDAARRRQLSPPFRPRLVRLAREREARAGEIFADAAQRLTRLQPTRGTKRLRERTRAFAFARWPRTTCRTLRTCTRPWRQRCRQCPRGRSSFHQRWRRRLSGSSLATTRPRRPTRRRSRCP